MRARMRPLSRSLLFVGVVLVFSPSWLLAKCVDHDGDGYAAQGQGCGSGSDCNDNDAAIHPGAQELCDLRDNDCNGQVDEVPFDCGVGDCQHNLCVNGQLQTCDPLQGASAEVCDSRDNDCDGQVDELGFTTCGVGQCQHFQPICINGQTQVCDPLRGATPEVCDGIDNDCNGFIDNGPGTDYDGDGYTHCDCNPNDASVHPFARDVCGDGIDQDCDGNVDDLQPDGQNVPYCFEVDPITAVANNTPNTVTLRGHSDAGVDRFWFQGTYLSCGGAPTCVAQTTVQQSYAGETQLNTRMDKSPSGTPVATLAPVIDFTCPAPSYCPPDPSLNGFISWMRAQHYAECMTSQYVAWSKPGAQNAVLREFTNQHGIGLTSPNTTLDFYDIVPTDSGATYLSLGAGEGGLCQPSANWPDFCPAQEPADYLFVKRKFETTFGVGFSFNYIRQEINYAQTFGVQRIDPDTTVNGDEYFRFGDRYNFEQQKPAHSIVHYSIQQYTDTGLPADLRGVQDMTGGSFVEAISVEPYNTLGAVTYSHEWGHTWGFLHSFLGYVPDPLIPLSFDGIMDNTYPVPGVAAYPGDPLSPIERYALEPVSGGYLDAAGYVQDYSSYIIGSMLLPTCGTVDVEVISGRIYSSNPSAWVFELTLRNNGPLPTGFLPLFAYNGDASSPINTILPALRTVGYISPGQTITHYFPLFKSLVTAGWVRFRLDPDNAVTETDETNNSVTVNLPPCPDSDGDGYSSTCTRCYPNAYCPVIDCNDADAGVNPSASEGPYASPTCADGKDNNCRNGIDAADPLCAPPPYVYASGETNPPGAGTIVSGNYFQTHEPDGGNEVLKEGGAGANLIQTWTFANVPPGTSHEFIFQGTRTTNSDNDDFKFQYSTTGAEGSFVDIPYAVISKPFEPVGGLAVPFATGGTSGTIYIRVVDTAGGSHLDSVNVNYLAIHTIF